MRRKPMLPTLTTEIQSGDDWLFEIKYDGFRCLLYIDDKQIDLYSRNLRSLNHPFPEVVREAVHIQRNFQQSLPLWFDGELCILQSDTRASFSQIQKRGRLKNDEKIQHHSTCTPATYLVFDILMKNGTPLKKNPYHQRKIDLKKCMKQMAYPAVSITNPSTIQWIPSTQNGESLFEIVKKEKGEGIVQKRKNSLWDPNKRTKDWLKIKKLYRGFFIVTGYEEGNGYVSVALARKDQLQPMGVFSHGLEGQEREALLQIVKKNQVRKYGSQIVVSPRICVELEFLELYKKQLRHPRFIQFRLDIHWEDCTWEALQAQMDS